MLHIWMYYSRRLHKKTFLVLLEKKLFLTFSSLSSPNVVTAATFSQIIPKSTPLPFHEQINNCASPPLSTLLPKPLDPFTTTVNLICSQLKEQELTKLESFQLQPHLAPFFVGKHGGQEIISCILLRFQSNPLVCLHFFQWAAKSQNGLHLVPSAHNFSILIHILSFSGHFSHAMQILSEFLNAYPHIDAFQVLLDTCTTAHCNSKLNTVFGMLLKEMVKMGRLNEALTVCQRVIHAGFIPNTSAFNSLINSLVNNSNNEVKNKIHTCWQLYYQMISLGVSPNSFTFNILIRALCQDKDAANAKKFLEEMEIQGFDPDVITYNTLIYSYCQRGRLDEAFYLYRIMYQRGILPNLVSYTILMSALCKDSKVLEAHQLFNKILKRGIVPDNFSYSVLVSGYCREGRLREARLLVEEMIFTGLRPNNFTCNVIVDGHIRAGKVLTCLNFIVLLRKSGIIITFRIYKFLISYLCIEKRPNAATNFFELMVQDGYKPDLNIYNMLIDSFCDCGFLKEALCLKDKMADGKTGPNIHTYQALISCFCRLGKAKEGEELISEMVDKDLQPNSHICASLFTAYCSNGDFYKAESLLKYFALNFQVYDITCYNALIRLFSQERGYGETLNLRDRMVELGYVPNWETSKYLISGLELKS